MVHFAPGVKRGNGAAASGEGGCNVGLHHVPADHVDDGPAQHDAAAVSGVGRRRRPGVAAEGFLVTDVDLLIAISESTRKDILNYARARGGVHGDIETIELGHDLGASPANGRPSSLAGAQGSFFFNIPTFSRHFIVVEDNNPAVLHDKPFIAADFFPGSPNRDTAVVSYTPDAGFSGTDTFTYQVSDGTSTSTATATNHAAVQHTAASTRPRFRSCRAATSTSRSERTT